MKAAEFRKDFEIDTSSKRGIKARRKNRADLPEAKTADNEIFDASQTYYFFDESTRKVRQSTGLRQTEVLFLGSFGLRVVEIAKLRNSKDVALSDGQIFLENRIAELNKLIAEFDLEKSSESQNAK